MIAIGLAILYGSGAVMFALMLLSVLHIPWSAASAMIALTAITIVFWIITKRTRHSALGTRFHFLDLFTAILFASFAAYVLVASPSEWDFWDGWGLKARVFLEHGGINWHWLESPWNDFAHPDYPPLVPLNYAFAALLQGGWNDRGMGLFFAVWAIAVLMIVRGLTAEETSNIVSAAATIAAAPIAMSLSVGTAEAALIAFAGAALLFLRRALRDDNPSDWLHGALLLGLAANCKNEGLATVAVAAVAIVVADPSRWRRASRLWPALFLAAPWLLMRAVHALTTDIAKGNIIHRFFERLSYPGEILVALNQLLVDRWIWIAIIATFLIVPRALSRERFIATVVLLQIAIYVAVYFITPNELSWHIATSWQRLPRQIELPITVVCVLQLADFLKQR